MHHKFGFKIKKDKDTNNTLTDRQHVDCNIKQSITMDRLHYRQILTEQH